MATATVQWAAARQDTTVMAMATCDNDDNYDGVTTMTMATMATARRATGYDHDGDDDGGGATGDGIR